MRIARRFLRTPTWTAIVIELILGVVVLAFAMLNAVGRDTRTEGVLIALIGAVGGLALGVALGMAQHLLTTRQAVDHSRP
jgi:NhaP-type Na+/H+ or K+/H+ antiporter